MLPVLPLLTARASGGTFEPTLIPQDVIHTLFDAVRCSASAYNEQPWSFVVGDRRDPERFQRVLGCFEPNNYKWAKESPLVAISFAKLTLDYNGANNPHAVHDLGMGVQNLITQATSLGMFVHQAAGIFHERIREAFGVPDHYVPVAGLAIGYRPAGHNVLDPRLRRKPLGAFVFQDAWGTPLTDATVETG